IVDNHFHVLVHWIDDGNSRNFRRTQRVRREHHRILGEFDDVDLFAAQLADDGLHAHALHAHASTDAVHVAIPAHHRDLGALAGFPGAALDHHRVVVNLGDFLLEQAHHQLGRGARHDDSGVLTGLLHTTDHAAGAVADAEVLEFALLFLEQARLGFAEVHHQVLTFDALHHAVDQFAHAPRIFRKNGLPLGFAH